MLHEQFCNFINAVMRRNSRDYIGQIWNQSEIVYGSCKAFIAKIYLR